MALWDRKRKKEERSVQVPVDGGKRQTGVTEEERAAHYEAKGWPPPIKPKTYRVW